MRPRAPGRPYAALVPRQAVVRLTGVVSTATVELDAVADREVKPWPVRAVDLGGGEGAPYVEAKLDRARVAAGDVVGHTLRR